MHRVVKPFPYSVDGFTLIDLKVGDKRDFGAMSAGLKDEGFIEPVAADVVIESTIPEADAAEDAPFEMAVDRPRRGRRKK